MVLGVMCASSRVSLDKKYCMLGPRVNGSVLWDSSASCCREGLWSIGWGYDGPSRGLPDVLSIRTRKMAPRADRSEWGCCFIFLNIKLM